MRRTWTPLRPGPLGRHDADRLNQALAELFQQVDLHTAAPLNIIQGPSGPVLTLDDQAVRNAPAGSIIEYASGTTIKYDDGSSIYFGDGGPSGTGPNVYFGAPNTWSFQSYGPFVWNNLAEWDINGTGPVVYNLPVTFNYPVSLNTPLSICGSMYWCCYRVPQWTWATYTLGTINNWTIPSSKTVYLISGNLGGSSNNPLTLTGIAPVTVSGSAKPLVIALVNVGTVPIWITDQSSNSSVGNRFALPGNGTSPAPTLVLDPGAAIIIWYDTCSGTGVWRVLSHSYTQFQGAGTYHCQGVVPDPGATAHNPAYVLLDSGGWGKLVATKGDLLATDGSNLNQLAVGPDGYVLTARSGTTNGFDWESPSGGGGAGSVNFAKLTISFTDLTNLSSSQTFPILASPPSNCVLVGCRYVVSSAFNTTIDISLVDNTGTQIGTEESSSMNAGPADMFGTYGNPMTVQTYFRNFAGQTAITSLNIKMRNPGGGNVGGGVYTSGSVTVWLEYVTLS